MCKQRKGRAGRTQPGICYRLLRRDFYRNQLLRSIPPEIERCPLEKCVLLGKSIFADIKPGDFLKDACAQPKQKDILLAIKSLKEINALTVGSSGGRGNAALTDQEDGDLTPLGQLMNRLPLDLSYSRLVYLGYMIGKPLEAIIMAACMSAENFWCYAREMSNDEERTGQAVNSLRSKLYWAQGCQSDQIAMLNAFVTWYQKMPVDYRENYQLKKHRLPNLKGRFVDKQIIHNLKVEQEWTQQVGLNMKALRQAHLYVEDILRRLGELGFTLGNERGLKQMLPTWMETSPFKQEKGWENDDILLLKFIIAGSSYPYYYNYQEIDQQEESRDSNNFNPTTTVYFKGAPPSENYKYGQSLIERMKPCGTIKRVYFDDTRIFFEFDYEVDRFGIFQRYGAINSYREAMKYNKSAHILPSVLLALKVGRKRNSDTSSHVYAEPTDALEPTEELSTRFYHFSMDVKKYKTAFPVLKHHEKRYRVSSELL